MLAEFMEQNRNELIARTRSKVAMRIAPRATPDELEHGVPLFLSQFRQALKSEVSRSLPSTLAITASATQHGSELLQQGFTIAQVVHDYGDICQAVTELALEQKRSISSEQFQSLNFCLDNAIAGAVTEYSRQREQNIADQEVERLGILAHELRNHLSTAMVAFQALQRGAVGATGSMGGVLGRSLTGLSELINRSLSEVRLAVGLHQKSRVPLSGFIEEIEIAATFIAKEKCISLSVNPIEAGVAVEVDRQLLASAVSNLLQNAFKFTSERGHVSLRVVRSAMGRVLIEIEDECGGLPPGKAEELFRPFERRAADKTGLGLGLTISMRAITAIAGGIQVRNLPGKGCIFTIDLPAAP